VSTKASKRRGPPPERLVIEGDWKDAVARGLRKKPDESIPKTKPTPKPKSKKRKP
jgi:hypothetical protein